MPRYPSTQPTDVELRILLKLWELGPSTVREVHRSLSPDRDTGYSTTLKMLQVMREKGLVLRDDSVRPQLYSAAKTKQETQLQMLDALTKKAFGGSAVSLMMRLLSERRISAEELEEIERLIREAREGDSL
jgi:BlaI family penicillinase repressor